MIGFVPFNIKPTTSGQLKVTQCCTTSKYLQWLKVSATLALTLKLGYQIIRTKGSEDLVMMAESVLVFCVLAIMPIVYATFLNRIEAVTALFNGILKFEKERPNELNRRRMSGFEKWFLLFYQYSGVSSSSNAAATLALRRWTNPCTSVIFAWYIPPECVGVNPNEAWSTNTLIILTVILAVMTWIFAETVAQYLIQEQDVFIPIGSSLGLLGFVTGLFGVVSLGSKVPAGSLCFFVLVFVVALASVMLRFGIYACLYSESCLTLKFLRTRLLPAMERKSHRGKWRLKWMKRYLESFYPLKVRMGEVNFVDKLTPINLLQFGVAQTTSLLLIR
ncbi:unnamed protein product [Orchesella dallaii]|uniref:Uncharacterized protein n=1 Tax=Orchesella dallaii TaxID=48710 RepID=A0ABP1S6U3_9HEXA